MWRRSRRRISTSPIPSPEFRVTSPDPVSYPGFPGQRGRVAGDLTEVNPIVPANGLYGFCGFISAVEWEGSGMAGNREGSGQTTRGSRVLGRVNMIYPVFRRLAR